MKQKALILISFLYLGSSLAFSQSKTYAFKAGYNVTCRVEKKVIAENSDFLILDANGDMVVAGVVKSVSPLLVISGDHIFYEGEQKVKATGDFSIINSPAGTFILNEKKGEALKIRPQNVVSASFETKTKSVSYSDPDGTSMLMRTQWQPSDSEDYYKKESLTVRIKNTLLSEYGYTDTDALLEHTPSGYDFVWTHGHRFIGDILCKQDENGIFYHLGLGKDIMPKMVQTLEISKSPGFYTYTRESIDDPNAAITKMIIEVPESVIQRNGYWNAVAMISGGEKGTFVYRNGDVFEGKYSAPVQNGGIASLTISQGTYRWPSGDVFTGDYSGRFVGGVPIDGELILSTGQAPLDKWWEVYQLTQDEWKAFEQYRTPTEKFAYATNLFAIHLVNTKIKEINSLLDKGKQDEALSVLREYRDIAMTTTAGSEWDKTIHQIEQNLKVVYSEVIADYLAKRDIHSAMTLALKEMGQEAPPDGPGKYEGPLQYEDFLANAPYRWDHYKSSGECSYHYTTKDNKRIRQGWFSFSNGYITLHGYYKNGKMDGPWIFISEKCEGWDFISLQCYREGVPNGLFIHVRDGVLQQYCNITNGAVDSEMFFYGKNLRFDAMGLLDCSFHQTNKENRVPYQYKYSFTHGILSIVEKIDDSLGSATVVFSGLKHLERNYYLFGGGTDRRWPLPDILHIHYGMLKGVLPVFYTFDNLQNDNNI